MAKWYDQRKDVTGNRPVATTNNEPAIRQALDKAEKPSPIQK